MEFEYPEKKMEHGGLFERNRQCGLVDSIGACDSWAGRDQGASPLDVVSPWPISRTDCYRTCRHLGSPVHRPKPLGRPGYSTDVVPERSHYIVPQSGPFVFGKEPLQGAVKGFEQVVWMLGRIVDLEVRLENHAVKHDQREALVENWDVRTSTTGRSKKKIIYNN
ncbi:hypothetical protein [Paeniglutamicibacter antarcticus]|uniref:hypothetical protein n=1 Tax=Paeniglutamicibacter antarcticus TaxID=494023 RepID=UPI0031F091E5